MIFWLGTHEAFSQQLAATPPLGWISYDCFGYSVYEDDVKATARYMAKKLSALGWKYVVVDYLWYFKGPVGKTRIPFQKRSLDGSFLPPLSMDQWGRLIPSTSKFPSAVNGKGFKPLADYVHKLGLLFGIHVMRGIPREAVWKRLPVKGTSKLHANQIADTTSTCKWLNHMYGIDMEKPGAQEYLNSLLDLYAPWGVDFIKVDDISFPYHEPEIEGYRKAIEQCGRPVVLSLSPGPTPLSKANNVSKNAQMWRVSDDKWDTWGRLKAMFKYARQWEGKSGNGNWPDFDILMMGKITSRGPGIERYSRFSNDELMTQMSLWCIVRSPLMIGGDLPYNRELELKYLTNKEVLAVDQHGKDPHQVLEENGTIGWSAGIPAADGKYVALFDTADVPKTVSVNFSLLGMKNRVAVRNLWQQRNEGVFYKKYQVYLPPHGAVLLRLSAVKQR